MAREVSPLPAPQQPPERADLRASHTDRDRVVEILRVAAGDGRLTADELDVRLEAALTARTYGELAVLTADLPADALPVTAGPARSPAVPARDLVTIDVGSAHTRRDGAWALPRRMAVDIASGHVRLDLTDAILTGPELDIDAHVKSGRLVIVTRPGIEVSIDDVAVRSGRAWVRRDSDPHAPVVLQVHVSGTVGSGRIIARPPRRTFWQWLTRQPLTYS